MASSPAQVRRSIPETRDYCRPGLFFSKGWGRPTQGARNGGWRPCVQFEDDEMHFWRNISIRTKIIAAFTLSTLTFVGLGVLALAQMSSFNASAEEMRTDWLPATDKIDAIEDAVQEFRVKEAKLLLVYDAHPDQAAAAEAGFQAAADAVDAAFREFEPFITPGTEDVRLMKRFSELWPKFRASARHTMEIVSKGGKADAIDL